MCSNSTRSLTVREHMSLFVCIGLELKVKQANTTYISRIINCIFDEPAGK